MKALIFAAGRGERMRPLTDHTPKPLLAAGGSRLIEWHLHKLATLGVTDVVVNTSWLAAQFPATLGDGARYGLRLHYSEEGPEPLETGGGMLKALALLGDAPFIAINGDVYCDMDLSLLQLGDTDLASLVLVDNPEHHPNGDFHLETGLETGSGAHLTPFQGRLLDTATPDSQRLTFAGIGLYRPQLLDGWREVIGATPGANEIPPRFKLAPLLYAAVRSGRVAGLHHRGWWTDVGTPQRLAELAAQLQERGQGKP
jgi:N-acetyl-alpha-D-muramate 1-phosphate uridylyltransferase